MAREWIAGRLVLDEEVLPGRLGIEDDVIAVVEQLEDISNISMLYLLPVLATAVTYGRGPAIIAALEEMLASPWEPITRIIPDGVESVRDAIVDLADAQACDLVLTTGGTGPAPRDLTPEGTQAACPKMMPGFGELLRVVDRPSVDPPGMKAWA